MSRKMLFSEKTIKEVETKTEVLSLEEMVCTMKEDVPYFEFAILNFYSDKITFTCTKTCENNIDYSLCKNEIVEEVRYDKDGFPMFFVLRDMLREEKERFIEHINVKDEDESFGQDMEFEM